MSLNRRQFSALAGATMTAPVFGAFRAKPSFEISLAQWSLHRTIYGGKLDNMGFPEYTKKEFGIEAVEYVNQFFKDRDGMLEACFLQCTRDRSLADMQADSQTGGQTADISVSSQPSSKPGQVRSGQVRSGQARSGEPRPGQARPG